MSPKQKLEPLPLFTAESRAEAKRWLDANRDGIPEAVANAVALSIVLGEQLADAKRGRDAIVRRLRVAMGIIPSSERRKDCKEATRDLVSPPGQSP